jgi:hypothetical protein
MHYLGTITRNKRTFYRFVNAVTKQVIEIAKRGDNKQLGLASNSAREYFFGQ